MKIDLCERCGMPIIWARHEFTGNAAPMNAEPAPNGNMALREVNGHIFYSIPPVPGRVYPMYTSHFVDCESHATPTPRRAPARVRTNRVRRVG